MLKGGRCRGVLVITASLILILILALPQAKGEEKININKATVEELQGLEGIGKRLARRIVKYREEKGPFERIEDILKVRGIGKKTFEKIRDRITVKDSTGEEREAMATQ